MQDVQQFPESRSDSKINIRIKKSRQQSQIETDCSPVKIAIKKDNLTQHVPSTRNSQIPESTQSHTHKTHTRGVSDVALSPQRVCNSYYQQITELIQKKATDLAKNELFKSETKFYSTNDLFLFTRGLSSQISSSTLRHTSPKFSFPKGTRFSEPNNTIEPTKIQLPSTLSKRYTKQGFGNKLVFQFQHQEIQAKTLPSPDRYEVREIPGKDKLKKSFGIPFDYYTKTYIPFNKHIPDAFAKLLPGPGEYNVRQNLAQHKYQYSMKGKGKMQTDIRDLNIPGPQQYNPVYQITSPRRFISITQGIGDKKDPFRSTSTTPGPGRYQISSPFDKFGRVNSVRQQSEQLI